MTCEYLGLDLRTLSRDKDTFITLNRIYQVAIVDVEGVALQANCQSRWSQLADREVLRWLIAKANRGSISNLYIAFSAQRYAGVNALTLWALPPVIALVCCSACVPFARQEAPLSCRFMLAWLGS